MFYGRNYYINLLEELLKKPMSSVVTCRGRRRVGKSTLFEEFARRNGCRFLKLEGRAPGEGVGDRPDAGGLATGLQTFGQRPFRKAGVDGSSAGRDILDGGILGDLCLGSEDCLGQSS